MSIVNVCILPVDGDADYGQRDHESCLPTFEALPHDGSAPFPASPRLWCESPQFI